MAFELKIGSGLLSDVSKSMQNKSSVDVQLIPPEWIQENRENVGLSMEGIEELQASIEDVGLKQLPVVVPDGQGMYRILAGHRRIAAVKKSIKEGASRYQSGIPCMVEDLRQVDLPVPDDIKEKYILATTNVEARELTTSDKIELARIMSEVYAAMESQGVKPKGKRRDYVANKLNVSPAQVQRIENIDRNLIAEFREQIDDMPLVVANSIAKLPREEQKQLYAAPPESKLTVEHVNQFKQSSKVPASKASGCSYEQPHMEKENHDKGVHRNTLPQSSQEEMHSIKKSVFFTMKSEMFRLNTALLEQEELCVPESRYNMLVHAVEEATNQLSKINQLILK